MSGNVLPFRPMDEALPNRIRELRKARGLLLEQLAERVGCAVSMMSDLERGKRDLTMHWMKRIARILKCRPGDLLNEADNSKSLSPAERELVDLYTEADDDKKGQVLQMVRMLVTGTAVVAPRRRRAANE